MMSPEQKKAASERMKARHAAKKAEKVTHPQPQGETVSKEDYNALERQVAELKALFAQQSQLTSPQVTSRGVIGTRERYNIDPNYYPDPRERLAKEAKLSRFAFDYNYELEFSTSSTRYQTIDGVWQVEPKFTLELNRVILDEETGEPTNGRYTICRLTFFEDPDAAIAVARQHDMQVDESNEREFLNEMRYLRMRDWLLEAFYPPRPVQAKENKRDMVVGGKMVQYFEVNSESSESIPFEKLITKL